MAKRKRKMTLFDVINSGQPIGVQVRQRVPSYQPTPELPIKKKLAKLFGRKPKDGRDPDQPLTAAEELELLRRELGGKPVVREEISDKPVSPEPSAKSRESATVASEEKQSAREEDRATRKKIHELQADVVEGEEVLDEREEVETIDAEPVRRHEEPFTRHHVRIEDVEERSEEESSDPTARFFAARQAQRSPREALRAREPDSRLREIEDSPRESKRAARRASEVARELSEEPPAKPRKPRKPMRLVMRDVWAVVSPQVERLRSVAQRIALASWMKTQTSIESLRNLNTRHAATLLTAVSGVIVLGGAFYVGKVLLQRPETNTALVDGINTTPRPDVLDVGSNEAVANVSRSANVTLEKSPPQQAQPQVATGSRNVFGGRNLDLNYVIVQSYYTQAEAEAAVEVLAKHNINATVEKNLPGWSRADRDFYSVVSADGFAKLRDNQVYQSFLNTIGKISDREAGSTLPKRLDPRPYKYVRSEQ